MEGWMMNAIEIGYHELQKELKGSKVGVVATPAV